MSLPSFEIFARPEAHAWVNYAAPHAGHMQSCLHKALEIRGLPTYAVWVNSELGALYGDCGAPVSAYGLVLSAPTGAIVYMDVRTEAVATPDLDNNAVIEAMAGRALTWLRQHHPSSEEYIQRQEACLTRMETAATALWQAAGCLAASVHALTKNDSC